jgi:hypothetical protein
VPHTELCHALAARLPDLPRWVEARALLLSGRGEIFGPGDDERRALLRAPPAAGEPPPALVVRHPASGDAVAVGTPPARAIREAMAFDAPGRSLVAPPELRDALVAALPDWRAGSALLHLLGDATLLPEVPAGAVRLLAPAGPDGVADLRGGEDAADPFHLPAGLLRELRIGADVSPIAAVFVDERPVAFCYAGALTETLWDVSIDTLEAHRGRGHAALAVAYMVRLLWAEEKQPVWGTATDNAASRRLAEKLGFVPVDELVLLEPPEAPRRQRR